MDYRDLVKPQHEPLISRETQARKRGGTASRRGGAGILPTGLCATSTADDRPPSRQVPAGAPRWADRAAAE